MSVIRHRAYSTHRSPLIAHRSPPLLLAGETNILRACENFHLIGRIING
jgi:hypothetical protein